MEPKDQKEKLLALRAEFEPNLIGKKPAPNKKQTEEVNNNTVRAEFCDVCKGYHHPKAQHLDYIGHAAITHRLLDVDPFWHWEPLALGPNGLPALDADGGLWIRLTVAGVSRLGYGDAGQKKGPDAMKERIGDALRNAGMRFGMGLELWHKGVLEMEPQRFESYAADQWVMKAGAAADIKALEAVWVEGAKDLIERGDRPAYDAFKVATNARKTELLAQEVRS
jgi:hypothetical protein